MFDDASALDSALEEICSDGPSDEILEDMDLLRGMFLLFNNCMFVYCSCSCCFFKKKNSYCSLLTL